MPPPKSGKGKKRPDSVEIAFAVDGVDYRCDLTAVTNRDELDLFKQSSLTMAEVREAFSKGGVPPFCLAAVMFLALRQAGDKAATYDALLDSIDRYDVDLKPITAQDDPPEA